MTSLREVLEAQVRDGVVPGVVALVARGDDAEVAAAGSVDVEGSAPMARDSIFRIASITKPITAAAVMMLVDDGRLSLDDAVSRWLPELASPMVVRTPTSALDDVAPADRPVTVTDLLTSRAGHGFPSDFTLPALAPLFGELLQGPPQPQEVAPTDEWMATLGRIPMLHQPGDGWLYNTSSDIQGVLVARVSGQPLPEFLAERVFAPLGMVDTGFAVPAGKLERFTSYYRPGESGALELVDAPNGQWSRQPAFPSGATGQTEFHDLYNDLLSRARVAVAEPSRRAGRQLPPQLRLGRASAAESAITNATRWPTLRTASDANGGRAVPYPWPRARCPPA